MASDLQSSNSVPDSLYCLAAIGPITRVAHGMNMVAKEYVAAQDPIGVPVLSSFAGAARESKGALHIDLYDVEGTANALARPSSRRTPRTLAG